MLVKFCVLTLLGIGPSVSSATDAATFVDLGRLTLLVSNSPTAQVFHIVDQLSEWDQYAHKQYGRWAAKSLNFNQEDRAMLREHANLRRARGWGHGFEQSFLVQESIEEAATKAIEARLLSTDEAIPNAIFSFILRPSSLSCWSNNIKQYRQ